MSSSEAIKLHELQEKCGEIVFSIGIGDRSALEYSFERETPGSIAGGLQIRVKSLRNLQAGKNVNLKLLLSVCEGLLRRLPEFRSRDDTEGIECNPEISKIRQRIDSLLLCHAMSMTEKKEIEIFSEKPIEAQIADLLEFVDRTLAVQLQHGNKFETGSSPNEGKLAFGASLSDNDDNEDEGEDEDEDGDGDVSCEYMCTQATSNIFGDDFEKEEDEEVLGEIGQDEVNGTISRGVMATGTVQGNENQSKITDMEGKGKEQIEATGCGISQREEPVQGEPKTACAMAKEEEPNNSAIAGTKRKRESDIKGLCKQDEQSLATDILLNARQKDAGVQMSSLKESLSETRNSQQMNKSPFVSATAPRTQKKQKLSTEMSRESCKERVSLHNSMDEEVDEFQNDGKHEPGEVSVQDAEDCSCSEGKKSLPGSQSRISDGFPVWLLDSSLQREERDEDENAAKEFGSASIRASQCKETFASNDLVEKSREVNGTTPAVKHHEHEKHSNSDAQSSQECSPSLLEGFEGPVLKPKLRKERSLRAESKATLLSTVKSSAVAVEESDVQELRATILNMAKDLSSIKSRYEDSLRILNQELASLKKRSDERKEELAALTCERDLKKNEAERAEAELLKLNSIIKTLALERVEWEKRYNDAASRLKESSKQAEIEKNDLEKALEKACEDFSDQLSEWKVKHDSLLKDFRELKLHLQNARQQVVQMEESKTQIEQKLEESEQTAEVKQREFALQLKDAKLSMKKLEKEKKQLEILLEEERQRSISHSHEMKAANQRHENQINEINCLQQEIESLRTSAIQREACLRQETDDHVHTRRERDSLIEKLARYTNDENIRQAELERHKNEVELRGERIRDLEFRLEEFSRAQAKREPEQNLGNENVGNIANAKKERSRAQNLGNENVGNISHSKKVVLLTGYKGGAELTKLKNSIEKLGGELRHGKFTTDVTHCIAKGRTAKMLKALLKGLWVMEESWVFQSLASGSFLEESKHGRRVNKKPFNGKNFSLTTSFHQEALKRNKQLVTICRSFVKIGGGQIVELGNSSHYVFVSKKENRERYSGKVCLDWEGFLEKIENMGSN